MTRVVVLGALGKMGTEVLRAVLEDGELDVAGLVDPAVDVDTRSAHPLSGQPVVNSVGDLDTGEVDVMVDFTNAVGAVANIDWGLRNDIHCVVGTTGITAEALSHIREKAESGTANVLIAPNFATGAVLMMRFAEQAARVFDQCEIVEMHHRGKLDAPSGTAIATARLVEEAMNGSSVPGWETKEIEGTRGGSLGDVHVHSVRLEGLVAHQEVIFGSKGQTLTIRHDSTDRSCFMPGVILAVKRISELPGLTIGLDSLL